MFTRILSALLIIVSISACKKEKKLAVKPKVIAKPEKPFQTNFNPISDKDKKELKSTIEAFYNEYINRGTFSGSFLVAKNGTVLYEDYQGYTNYKTKDSINTHSSLHLASISKVLTAAVILRLIDAGKLELNQKLNTIFPDFPYRKVTIKTLLNHRSGIPNYAYFTYRKNVWNTQKTLYNKDILELLCTKKIPLDFRTNKHFSYCNTNYALLALVIENITGLSYPEAMKQMLFDPLEMNDTFVLDYDKEKDSVSQTYRTNWQKVPYDFLDAIYGDKNIYSTPQDLLKFDLATYSNDFFSEDIKEAAFKGYSYESRGVKNYGLGIRLNEWKNHETLFYHNGWWHGNTTSYITLKKDTVTMIALSNNYHKSVYKLKKLSSAFGDYPFELD